MWHDGGLVDLACEVAFAPRRLAARIPVAHEEVHRVGGVEAEAVDECGADGEGAVVSAGTGDGGRSVCEPCSGPLDGGSHWCDMYNLSRSNRDDVLPIFPHRFPTNELIYDSCLPVLSPNRSINSTYCRLNSVEREQLFRE